MKPIACEKSRFLSDTKNHVMTVIRNDGVYRHIRFQKPGTMCMHFDLITWPGYLCYTGDMGTYVFTRLRDMFDFFRRHNDLDGIDFRYWAEKVEAAEKHDGIKRYSPDKFRKVILDCLDSHESSHKPDDDEDYEKDRQLHAAAYAELREAVEYWVLTCADDGDARAFDAANDFRHEGPAWQEFHGDTPFEFQDFFEYDLEEFTSRFVWCCYALAWGIDQFDKVTTPQTAPEAA